LLNGNRKSLQSELKSDAQHNSNFSSAPRLQAKSPELNGNEIEVELRHTKPVGTLHVSLPTDIIQFLGPGSVPVVVAGTVLGVFELGDRFASQQAKDALSKWLLTFDLHKAKALPDGTKELFERIFGKRHFSLKCFIRSVVFSCGAMAFVGILALLINPHLIKVAASASIWSNVPVWLPWSVIIDYISLLKTRVVLRSIARLQLRNMFVAIAVLVVDYLLYIGVFNLGLIIIIALALFFLGNPGEVREFISGYSLSIPVISPCAILDIAERSPGSESELCGPQFFFFIIFWAGFVPSIWMWLYVFALFVTRLLLRSEHIVNWLRWALDIDKNPFRSIGAVAAALAFIGSVVIIFVSAEISTIRGALRG
jgi:hypothetical protein